MLECDTEIGPSVFMNLLACNQWGKRYIKDEAEFDLCPEGEGSAQPGPEDMAIETLSGHPLKFWQMRMGCGSACGPAALTPRVPGMLALSQQHQHPRTTEQPAWQATCIISTLV